jgi:hypothetical protein
MAVRVLGERDSTVGEVAEVLEHYQSLHPAAEIDVYRYSPVSIRIRVVDPDYQTLSRSERSKLFWPILRRLPEDPLSEVSLVLLIPPEEKETSPVSREFDAGLYAREYGEALSSSKTDKPAGGV